MDTMNKNEWKIFMGSSSQAIAAMDSISALLESIQIPDHKLIVKRWDKTGSFKAGEYTLENLFNLAKEVDFAIFIYAEDDKLLNKDGTSRGTTRANVVFEHGLFMGALGCLKENAIAISLGESIRKNIQSDLYGVTIVNFDEDKPNLLVSELKQWLEKRINNEKINTTNPSIVDNFEIKVSIVDTYSGNDKRDLEFALLYDGAIETDELYVMGMGVTNFLNNDNRIMTVLNKGVKVKVLLMFDRIIRNDWICRFEKIVRDVSLESNYEKSSICNNSCPMSIANILIDEKHFGKYQNKSVDDNKKYIHDMNSALDKCKRLKKSYNNFDYSCFFSFIPMSLTAIKDKKMIVEYIIPFTNNRILFKISYNQNKYIYEKFMNFYDSVASESRKGNRLNNINKKFNKTIVENPI